MSSANGSVIITGTGSYAPTKTLTNDELAKIVDTSDEWIYSRSGIKERRIAAEGENASDMGFMAAQRAIENANLKPEDIGVIIVATMTPDMPTPSTACLIQTKLGIKNAVCLDIQAACSGFLYALEVGTSLLQSGRYKHALVIGSEKLSSILDWNDRTTCVLFGDGAGATVISKSDAPDVGIVDFKLGADGDNADLLYIPGRPSKDGEPGEKQYLKMRGREIFKLAVKVMEQSALEILERNGIKSDQLKCVIPHQANQRIIDSIASRLGLPMERFFLNLDRYGNTSAASIPIALDEAYRSGRIKKGDLILLVAFGAGLTWGAALVK